LLAAHTVDLVNRSYRQKQTGLVLWVMPTTQIYRQTIEHLRNRDHSYRQVLDIASGGRTVIYEKTDRFTPEDVAENLVVLTLMLPSASRQNKETLKVFKTAAASARSFQKTTTCKATRSCWNGFRIWMRWRRKGLFSGR